MTTTVRLLLLLALASGSAVRGEDRMPAGLQDLLPGDAPWVVLGFVTDAEKNPGIEAAGHDLRKRMESALQAKGARILPLAAAERLKWEQAWSYPFKARLGPEVKDLAKAEKANLLAGFFAPQEPGDVTFLAFVHGTERDLVFHAEDARSAAVSPSAPPRRRPAEDATDPGQRTIRLPSLLEPRRERPMPAGSGARDDKGRSAGARLAEELRASPELRRVQEGYAGKPAEGIRAAMRAHQDEAASSLRAATAVEHLEQAYILALLLPDAAAVQEELLRDIAERRAFLSDWSRGRR